jgi:hypothetical protein
LVLIVDANGIAVLQHSCPQGDKIASFNGYLIAALYGPRPGGETRYSKGVNAKGWLSEKPTVAAMARK